MSKDIDRAFLSSITYGLGCIGDIDCICAVISVFLLRRGYFCEINVISRENDSGHATIESWNFREECPEKRAITVWHCKGSYDVCRGISDKKRPNEEETVEFFSYDCDYPGLLDILDSVFPERAEANMEYDYFSKLFLKRIGSAENEARAQAENDACSEIRKYIGDGKQSSHKAREILKNQDDVERIIFCALLDLMESAHEILYFANVISALLMWRGYDDVFPNIIPCVRHISLSVPTTILSEGLETCIEISDDASCVLKVTVNKQKHCDGRIEPDAVYKQSINSKYDPSFKGNTYDGLYDFLSEKFPRQVKCYRNDIRMPAYLNVADLQSCFSSHHADVELDPIRFYPRSLTKEIYKLEKANNGQVLCRICHKPIETFSDCSADHIVPYSKGGKTTLSNMQLAHKSCNSKKRDKIKSDDDENWIV